MVETAWNLGIEAQDHQRALAGAPAGTPSVWQLRSGPSLKIDPQTREAVSLGFCSMLLYQIYHMDYAPNYTQLKLKISTVWGQLVDGARRTVVHSYQLDMRSGTELRIQLKEHLFDVAYLSKVVFDKMSWFTQRKCLISFTVNFSLWPTPSGASQQHRSRCNFSLRRLYGWSPQLFILRCLTMQVEWRPQLRFLKMNIQVHCVHPPW